MQAAISNSHSSTACVSVRTDSVFVEVKEVQEVLSGTLL